MAKCLLLEKPPRAGPKGGGSPLRVITLDVDNRTEQWPRGFVAEAVVVVTPGGKTMLIDAAWPSGFSLPRGGPVSQAAPNWNETYGANLVLPFLKAQGIASIDWIVASHPHWDHIGGLPEIVLSEEVSVARVLWSPLPDEKILETEGANAPFYVQMSHDLAAACARRGVPLVEVSQGDRLDLGDGVICDVLAAAEPDVEVFSYVNNNSIVMRLAYRDFSMMFTGDAGFVEEDRIMALGQDLSTDVLKIGHHAGANSTSEAWVEALGARVGVASMPRWLSEDPRGERVYELLKPTGIRIYRTWEHGHVEVQSDGKRYWVITQR